MMMTKMTRMKGNVPFCAVLAAIVAVACLGFVPSAEALGPESISLKSDADVSALASEISADGVLQSYEKVKISGDVTDLSPLSALRRVENGSLIIQNTTALADLTGLENLDTVDLAFDLEDNKKLESIALDSLVNVGSGFWIKGNEELASVSLPELSSVGGSVRIRDNPLLSTLSLNVSSVGDVYIGGNGLEALGETVQFGSVVLDFKVDEENLASVDGFAVDSVGRSMKLEGGPKLTSLEGMQIGSVGEMFIISGKSLTQTLIPGVALSADSIPTDLAGIAGKGVYVNGFELSSP